MSSHRPHIHIICDNKDTSLYPLLDALAIHFEPHAYLTRDLFLVGSESANYSWKCINECDYVIFLIGMSYGELNNTGVSQLHISYLNAKTKNKPIAVFVTNDDSNRPRQLLDLIQVVNTQVECIYPIAQSTNIKHLLIDLDKNFIKPHKSKKTESTPHKTKSTNETLSFLPSSTGKSDTTPTKTKLNPQDEVLLNCTAHAFRGGTLIEATFLATTTWQAILASLDNALAFNSQGLWRALNTLVTPQAMPAIKATQPTVHAISRCQVVKADMLWVEEELQMAQWIAPTPTSTGTKSTWYMTDSAKKYLT